MRSGRVATSFLISMLVCMALRAADLPAALPMDGDVKKGKEDVSAVVATDEFLIVGSDEKASIQVLERKSGGRLAASLKPIDLLDDGEADIEGIALGPLKNGQLTVYAIGCHCKNRRTVKADLGIAANLKRLETVEEEETRANVYRLKVDAETGKKVGDVERKSLSSVIAANRFLGLFTAIPSKENGVDIEGLAVGPDGKLFAGFRGPVLRGNFTPVLVLDFDHPNEAELRFVELGGLGIRDMAPVRDGFLLLAGPVGDGRADFRIFFWGGKDGVLGSDRTHQPPTPLFEVPLPQEDAKAEGLALLEENDCEYKVLIVYDGIKNGRPTPFTVPKKP